MNWQFAANFTELNPSWASYQIRINYGLRMCRECRERFPHHCGSSIPTCITTRASRTCRDACRNRYLAVFFGVGGGENVPGIPGASAIRNFTYLVRGPLSGNALDGVQSSEILTLSQYPLTALMTQIVLPFMLCKETVSAWKRWKFPPVEWEPTIHCNWSNHNVYLDQLITKEWC